MPPAPGSGCAGKASRLGNSINKCDLATRRLGPRPTAPRAGKRARTKKEEGRPFFPGGMPDARGPKNPPGRRAKILENRSPRRAGRGAGGMRASASAAKERAELNCDSRRRPPTPGASASARRLYFYCAAGKKEPAEQKKRGLARSLPMVSNFELGAPGMRGLRALLLFYPPAGEGSARGP